MGTSKKTTGTGTKRTASAASLRSQIGVDFDYVDACLQSFVFDEVMQLEEAPAMKPEINSSAFFHLPDSFQIFQDNSSCITVVHNLFADYMVPVSLETSLSARNLLQEFLSGAGAFALEPCSQSLEFESVLFDFTSTKELLTACHSDVVYSDVNTNMKSVRNLADVDISGKRDMEKHPVLLVTDDSDGLSVPVEILPIILWNFDWHSNSSFAGSELYLFKTKFESSCIEVKRHELLEGWLDFQFSGLEGLGSNPVCIDDELGWQLESLPYITVAEMVELESVVDLGSKSSVSNVADSFAVLLHHIDEQGIARNLQFDCGYRLHNHKKTQIVYKPCVCEEREWAVGNGGFAFLPILKDWVSSEYVA